MFSLSRQSLGTQQPDGIMLRAFCGNGSPQSFPDVGGIGHAAVQQIGIETEVASGDALILVQAELDAVITDLCQHMVWAQSIGDTTGARLYLERANAMRASRTPEHQARLDAEDRQRLEDLTFDAPWTDEVLRRMGRTG